MHNASPMVSLITRICIWCISNSTLEIWNDKNSHDEKQSVGIIRHIFPLSSSVHAAFVCWELQQGLGCKINLKTMCIDQLYRSGSFRPWDYTGHNEWLWLIFGFTAKKKFLEQLRPQFWSPAYINALVILYKFAFILIKKNYRDNIHGYFIILR